MTVKLIVDRRDKDVILYGDYSTFFWGATGVKCSMKGCFRVLKNGICIGVVFGVDEVKEKW